MVDKNLQRSKQVVTVTAPCLVIGIVLMIALGVQQVKGSSPDPTPDLVPFRGKTLPGAVSGDWQLRADNPTLDDTYSGYYRRTTDAGNQTVSMRFGSGGESEWQRQLGRIEGHTTVGLATCGTNPINNLDYCYVQGSDNTYLSFFSSSTTAQEIGELVSAVVPALS